MHIIHYMYTQYTVHVHIRVYLIIYMYTQYICTYTCTSRRSESCWGWGRWRSCGEHCKMMRSLSEHTLDSSTGLPPAPAGLWGRRVKERGKEKIDMCVHVHLPIVTNTAALKVKSVLIWRWALSYVGYQPVRLWRPKASHLHSTCMLCCIHILGYHSAADEA